MYVKIGTTFHNKTPGQTTQQEPTASQNETICPEHTRLPPKQRSQGLGVSQGRGPDNQAMQKDTLLTNGAGLTESRMYQQIYLELHLPVLGTQTTQIQTPSRILVVTVRDIPT